MIDRSAVWHAVSLVHQVQGVDPNLVARVRDTISEQPDLAAAVLLVLATVADERADSPAGVVEMLADRDPTVDLIELARDAHRIYTQARAKNNTPPRWAAVGERIYSRLSARRLRSKGAAT